ncbi:MAG: nucleotidyl transferase AbiEii/AbiGii toxin family protein [Micavibrio sp.]|nr:nucleotidyl transferase AbiEii/AbiGii toxin family protein [Micavibrio sp.]
MNAAPSKELFEQVADRLGIDKSFVEKDWFVTQAISLISGVNVSGFEVVFTGGTALSKAHGLLERFSEDVDFRVQASEELRNRKDLSNLRKSVVAILREGGFIFTDEQVRSRDENRFFSIDLAYDSHFIKADALRPHILIEVTTRNTQLPPIHLPVASFVSTAAKKPPEVAQIACIDPVESAADKLSALAWRIPDRVRNGKYDDPTIVRHLHDLALLKDKALAHEKFAALAAASMTEDSSRPKNRPELVDMPPQERLKLMLKILSEDAEYPPEYDLFVKGVSYAVAEKIPTYASAIEAVRVLTKTVFSE